MSWVDTIIAAHREVTDLVSHGGRLKSDRYFVWQEDGAADFIANGRRAEKAMTGSSDLFSKIELDPWREAFETAMDMYGIAWQLDSVHFEIDTGFWHWKWTWGIRYG